MTLVRTLGQVMWSLPVSRCARIERLAATLGRRVMGKRFAVRVRQTVR
jgi:hypothetical protein